MINKNNLPKIEKDYKDGYTYNKLAEKYKLTYNQVTYLIKKNKWKRESNLSLVHIGNKNAVGNSGGPGAETGNKRARALQQGNVAMVNDQVVYLWATNYFKYTNEELGITKKGLKPETNKKESKKEDKKEEKKAEKKEDSPQISMFGEVQK